MASTRQLNDECYFKTLCDESKAPGNYVLYNGASTNNNKCYPRETPTNTKMNYKNVNIENNLLNITTKSSKCPDGNTLSDKRKGINNNDMQSKDCNSNISTQFSKSNLNIINRGNPLLNKNIHPNNHPHGNNLDFFNNGTYGFSRCASNSPEGNISKCYNTSDTQRLTGINTTLEAKTQFRDLINLYGLRTSTNNNTNNIGNNFLDYDNTIITNQWQNK